MPAMPLFPSPASPDPASEDPAATLAFLPVCPHDDPTVLLPLTNADLDAVRALLLPGMPLGARINAFAEAVLQPHPTDRHCIARTLVVPHGTFHWDVTTGTYVRDPDDPHVPLNVYRYTREPPADDSPPPDSPAGPPLLV